MPQSQETEPHVAYARGRNSVWMEEKNPACPFVGDAARHWNNGRRDALREVKLDADTEWDGD